MALTVTEVAMELRVSRVLVYQLIRSGTLPAVRLGKRRLLVPRAVLRALLDETCQK